jgi:transcriptional regulator of acetoin/glycerol metabolism
MLTANGPLLMGEPVPAGTVARYIHGQSRRSNGPFIAVNCRALPDMLGKRRVLSPECLGRRVIAATNTEPTIAHVFASLKNTQISSTQAGV